VSIDDETPTPPSWFAFRSMADDARKTADALDHVAMVSSKRIDLLNLPRARRAEQIADRLRQLARIFGRWDEATESELARVRETVFHEFTSLLREALAMLKATPSRGALGPVRRR
jgi:hypothetical protein